MQISRIKACMYLDRATAEHLHMNVLHALATLPPCTLAQARDLSCRQLPDKLVTALLWVMGVLVQVLEKGL